MLLLEVQPHELFLFVSKVSHCKTNQGVIGGSPEQQELAQSQHLDKKIIIITSRGARFACPLLHQIYHVITPPHVLQSVINTGGKGQTLQL